MRTVPHVASPTHESGVRPTSRDTAAAVGQRGGVEAVATVAMILWIEATCGELMAPYLETGRGGCRDSALRSTTPAPAFAGRPVAGPCPGRQC